MFKYAKLLIMITWNDRIWSKPLLNGEKNKPAIVFFHGLTSNSLVWHYTMESLSRYFYCIAPDMPGHGNNSAYSNEYTIKELCDYYLTVIDHYSIASFHLVGHSMGGQIGIYLTRHFPERVKSLTLIAPAGIETFTSEESRILLAYVNQKKSIPSVMKGFVNNPFQGLTKKPDTHLGKVNDQSNLIYHGIRAMLKQPVVDYLDQIKVKTVLFFGGKDLLIPNRFLHPMLTTRDIFDYALEYIYNSEGHFLENGGHYLQLDHMEFINYELYKSLNKIENYS